MEIGKTFYARSRTEWRAWLKKHHSTASDIWLVYYRKDSGKPRIPYNDAVEEALCFGWIDSIVKKIDAQRFAQRFSRRKPKSVWSAMNLERVRRLIARKKMTKPGMAALNGALRTSNIKSYHLTIPPDILKELKKDPAIWKNFSRFPSSYKRIRIGWINGSRNRPKAFRQRLDYFLKMTAMNKRYGMVQ